jgi:hypothetical protein
MILETFIPDNKFPRHTSDKKATIAEFTTPERSSSHNIVCPFYCSSCETSANGCDLTCCNNVINAARAAINSMSMMELLQFVQQQNDTTRLNGEASDM